MRAIQFASMILVMLLAAPVWAAAPAYQIIDRIKVGDGRFDYAVFDDSTNRVYMSRSFTTTVIDVKTGKVSQLDSAANGHMTLPIPGTTLAVVPRAQGMELPIPRDAPGLIRIVDLKTDSVVADLPAGINPDGAVYDTFSKLVFVMNHVSGESTVVDPVKHAVVATIPVGGTLEFPASDGAGKVFVNVQDQNRIGIIDVKTMKVVGYYPLAGCQAPTGLAYIPGENLLVSACGNGVAKIISADTGKEIASPRDRPRTRCREIRSRPPCCPDTEWPRRRVGHHLRRRSVEYPRCTKTAYPGRMQDRRCRSQYGSILHDGVTAGPCTGGRRPRSTSAGFV